MFDSYASSYNGDGWCDDGAYGLYLDCAEFNNDSGDWMMLLLVEQMTHAYGQMMVHSDEPWYYCWWYSIRTDVCGTCTSGCKIVEITNEQASAKKADIYAYASCDG